MRERGGRKGNEKKHAYMYVSKYIYTYICLVLRHKSSRGTRCILTIRFRQNRFRSGQRPRHQPPRHATPRHTHTAPHRHSAPRAPGDVGISAGRGNAQGELPELLKYVLNIYFGPHGRNVWPTGITDSIIKNGDDRTAFSAGAPPTANIATNGRECGRIECAR